MRFYLIILLLGFITYATCNTLRLSRQTNDLGCKLPNRCPYKKKVCAIGPKGESRSYSNQCLMKFDQCLLQSRKLFLKLIFIYFILINYFFFFRT